MDLPVYLLSISEDDDSEVTFVSLVDKPAIQKNFLVFNEQHQQFKVVDEDKRIISGPLMLADVPIYRNDAEHGEYYVMFNTEGITKAAQKFFRKGYQNNINLFHDAPCDGVSMFESWIVDPARGTQPLKGFEDAKPGSWFGSMKVNCDDTWKGIKEGKLLGFSVEGLFGYQKMNAVQSEADKVLQKIKEILSDL